MTDTKVSRKAPEKPTADKATTPSGAPELQVATPSTPKPPRKRAPAMAEGALSEVKKPAAAALEAKPAKSKKAKLVRDSFTMPEVEYAAIATLKERCLRAGIAAKKSEILRAAIAGLAKLSDAKVTAAIKGLEAIKTGRPGKAAR